VNTTVLSNEAYGGEVLRQRDHAKPKRSLTKLD
jgi:hypothetical protein